MGISKKKIKNVLTKNRYIKFFPVAIIPAIVGLALIFNYLFNTFKPYLMIENEGFMLGNNDIASVLNKEDIEKYDNSLDVVDVHEADYIYKMALDKYTNEDKKAVDINYPIFINDGLSIINYNENTNVIDSDLRRYMSSSNQVFSYGKLYELNNYEPIDNINYILLNYANGVYINLYDLKIKTNAHEYNIPVNSFVYFLNNRINYYERNNNEFIKKQVIDVDYDSILSFYYESNEQNYSYRYEDFLIGLGKLYKEETIVIPPKEIIDEKDQIEEVEEEIVPTPTATPKPSNEEEKPNEGDFVWVKPSVTSTKLESNVYSATGTITIHDPANVIVKVPTFTVVYNGKTYARRSYNTSGDFILSGLRPESTFEVVGQYTYLDEDMKTKKIVTFFSQTITTKSMEGLDPIELNYTLGDIYARKIELKDLVVTSNIKSEALRGVRSVAFIIDGENYYLTSQNVNRLINGIDLKNISTSESLSSNKEYNFEIGFFDTVGNKMNVINGTGRTRTSKKMPSVVLKIAKNEIDYVILNIDLKNDDHVDISNYRYVITNTSGRVIQQGAIENSNIRIEDLDPNQIFTVRVFGDFDLNDGKGLKKDYELANVEFTSLPITSLGFLNLRFETDSIDDSSINFKYRINSQKTDERLIKLVKNIEVKVIDQANSHVVKMFNINGNDLEQLKELSELEMFINGLDSNTKYTLNINTRVQQGDTIYDLECLHNIDFFETYKRKPVVDMESTFVTNDMIDFDVRIIDTDGAILSSRTRVELRDNTNKLVASKLIGVNQDFERITYKYLKTNTTYYIIFIADEYNETNNNSTFKARYELARVEKYTEDGISGKIELNSAVKVATGENIVDMNSETKWIQTTNYYTIPKTIDSDGNMHIYAKKGTAAYMYDLSDYHGEYVTVSFKIKAVNRLTENVYLSNYVTGYNNSNYSILLNRISTDEWTSYTYSFMVGYYFSGQNFVPNRSKYYGRYYTDFVGFYIDNVPSLEGQAEYIVKDFEIYRSKERVLTKENGYELEKGAYDSNGKKNNSGNYNDYRVRATEAIILEGNQAYRFDFSDDLNYTAYIYFTDMNNKYISAYGWFDSSRIVYVPENTKVYIMFRYYSANMPLNPDDIHLTITKYVDRDIPDYSTFTYDFITTVKVNVKDLHDEISNDNYYIRVSDGNNHELFVKEYHELVNTDSVVDALKNLDLEEDKEYRVSLFILVRDREYELDFFDISTNKETVGIANTNDWAYIQPNGNYIVLNDLDFENFTLQAIGWGYRTFSGIIDFQGKSATIYTYTTNVQRIGRIEPVGVLKNLVLNVHLTNDVSNTNIHGFVSNNLGTIENVMINVYDEREKYFDDSGICLLLDNNAVTGRVSNFAINLRTRLNLYWDTGLLVRANYGLIENGYVQGENAFVTNAVSGASARNVALIQRYGGIKSTVQNVYILSSIEFPNKYSYDLTGLIAYETYGTVKNVYTTGNVSTINQAVGPIVGYVRATANFNNAYYLNDSIYTTLNQNRISVMSINDLSFQKSVLKNGFNIDEMLELGYYPQVQYTYDKMPSQDFVELPKSEDKDLVDILNIDLVSQTNSSAIFDLTIQNEFGDEITNVAISNLDTEIVSQTYEDGKSYVRIEVSNPQVFVSKYEIRGITSRSYNNISSERKYSPGDKYLYVEMYREIHNIQDWMQINSFLNQNFAIMEDLDFSEYVNYTINNYTGTLNGNNHVLKNILIPSGKHALFNQMNGTLKNIFFENVMKTADTYYNGLVGTSNQYGKFNNVHIKNMTIVVPSTRTSNTSYTGGLVAYTSYTKITNCSITNLSISVSPTITDVMVGGMVGYSNSSTIENVYVQNADIEVKNAINTTGVGGILGREASTVGVVSGAYSTGNIYTNGRYSGGIVGFAYGYVENSYSMMNIVSESKDVGGISGNSYGVAYINDNLFIGNLSSKQVDATIHRIVGEREVNDTNYGLTSSLINGRPTNETNGEKLLKKSDLLKPSTYNDDGLKLGNAFDYSRVSEGLIPKLFYMGTDELLPNQEDIHFFEDTLEVDDVVIDKHVEYSDVVLYLKNPDHFIIDDVIIENLNVEITGNSYQNGISIITLRATPIKYYDSYVVKEIKYHIDGTEEQLSCEKTLILEMIFYKNLRTFDDWQNVSKTDAENYILVNDIDFTGLNFNRDVVFNRLETVGDGEVHSLKGMHFTQTSSKSDLNIIKKIETSLRNIKFEDINIQFTQASNNSYTNIICYMFGKMNNVTFENITINAPAKDSVALVGRTYTEVIDNIKIKDVTVTGRNNVSAFLVTYDNNNKKYTITNVEAENVNVTGSGNYIGGVLATINTGSGDEQNIHHITVKDSTITGVNGSYVGGVGGRSGGSYVTADNVHVIGREFVGGAFGYAYGFTMYHVTVKNSNIEGSYRYIGGLAGQMRNYLYYSDVYDTTVTGTASDTYGVGGFFGYHNYYYVYYNSIRNCTITNNGNATGGLIGYMNQGTLTSDSVDNVIVTGANNVGGMIGELQIGTITNSRVTNTTVNAQQKHAGGIAGYFNNSVSGTTFNEAAIRNVTVLTTNISSNNNAGGLFGNKNESLYYAQNNYGMYFHGDVSTTDGESAYLGSGNGAETDVLNLGRMGYYAYSKINGTPIKNKVTNTTNNNNLITGIYQGWVNENTGAIEVNYNYPLASYTDFIKLTAGKTYVLKGKNAKKSQSDIFRVRVYDANKKYVTNLGWNTNTFNYFAAYFSISYLNELYLTPVRDIYIRVLYYYELEETSLMEVSSTYSNLLSRKLFSGGQLRNRLLWNRYYSEDLQDFGGVSYFSYDQKVWDMSKLKNEVTNMNVPDNSGNNHTAKASFTALTDLGVLLGGTRDEVKIENFTPGSNITISAKFTSISTRAYQYIFSYRDPSTSSGVGLFLHYSTMYVMINGSTYSSSQAIPLYKEVNVTMTYENNKVLKVYYNGELVYTHSSVNKTIKTTDNAKTFIGNDTTYSGTYKFLGAMRRVDVYNRALPEQEIRDNYIQSYGVTNNSGLMLSYDFGALDYEEVGYYPELIELETQGHVPLPSKSESVISPMMSTLSSPKRAALLNEPLDGIYHIYSSSIDTINLEFDKVSNGMSFTYQKGDKEETINVERRVYTLNYDYNSDIVIKIRNAYEEKVINLTKNDLRKTISIYNNKYYYIKDNNLYESNNLVLENVRHIYKNLVLLDNNNIYNLSTNNTQTPIHSNDLIVSTMPLYQTTIDGVSVSTYYNFTEVIDTNSNTTIRDNQIIYKDGYLYTVDVSNKDMASVIVNNYNGSEYQMVIGLDKELYSYKTSLNMHSSFINANIKEIYGDFETESPIIMIMYDNGEVLVLNYYNGEKLYDNGEKQDISLIDYIGLSLTDNEVSTNNNSYNNNNSLKDSLDTLTDKEITDILDNTKPNNSSNNNSGNNNSNNSLNPVDDKAIIKTNTVNNKYTVSYNEDKGEYEVYDVDDILFGDSQISVNEKINNNQTLYNYFYTGTNINEVLKDNRTIIYMAIISLIIVNLVYFVMKYRRKEVENE